MSDWFQRPAAAPLAGDACHPPRQTAPPPPPLPPSSRGCAQPLPPHPRPLPPPAEDAATPASLVRSLDIVSVDYRKLKIPCVISLVLLVSDPFDFRL